MATMPTRVDSDLFEAARAAGELYSRSAAQQIAHWARLGRELEGSPSVTQETIARVLSGQGSYDALAEREQAAIRVEWDSRISAAVGSLDFTEELQAAGRPWAEAGADGELVVREPAAAPEE